MSKSLGMTTSCGTSLFSTRSTCASAGPRPSARSSAARATGVPEATTSTDPSRRLRANPRSPSRCASRITNQRKPTPCTRPDTRKRVASMLPPRPLALTRVRRAPPVPPHVRERKQHQDGNHDQDGAAGVTLRLLVEHRQDHVFPASNEPADPREDGAPHERSQPGEQDEATEPHTRDPGGNRDQ